jgi:hypothetical protein
MLSEKNLKDLFSLAYKKNIKLPIPEVLKKLLKE